MEASGRMLEVILLLGHWLHSRQSVPLQHDRLPEVIARMKDEEKLSNAIYKEAAALTEEELDNLIVDLDQMKLFIISARDIAYPEEVEECR
jgi:hypothetical protein